MDDVSVEAEQALLGALLADPGAWDLVSDVARPEHYGLPSHRVVADLVYERLAAPGTAPPFDPVLLLAALEAERKLQPAGPVPRDLPLLLAGAIGTSGNVRYYAEVLQGLWLRRAVRAEARAVLEDKASTGKELVARLAARTAVLETRGSQRARRLHEIVLARGDFFEAQQRAAADGREPPMIRIPTGFRRLDRMIGGVAPGQVVVVGARPGTGKTALESALADNFAANGAPVCIFQLEDYGDSLADRAIARRSRINSMLLRDASRWPAGTWDRFMAGAMRGERLPIWVDDEHGLSPLDVVGKMRQQKRENGIRVFMLDVLAELDVERWQGGGRLMDDRLDRLLGKALKLLRDTAKALDAALLVFLHLNRDIEKRADPTPRLSDIKNSGELEDAAHQVWFLSRPEEPKGFFVIDVAKHRDGPTGRVMLSWLEDYMAVENPPDSL